MRKLKSSALNTQDVDKSLRKIYIWGPRERSGKYLITNVTLRVLPPFCPPRVRLPFIRALRYVCYSAVRKQIREWKRWRNALQVMSKKRKKKRSHSLEKMDFWWWPTCRNVKDATTGIRQTRNVAHCKSSLTRYNFLSLGKMRLMKRDIMFKIRLCFCFATFL